MSEQDKAELPEELTITLRVPVKLGDVSYDHLDLREPTAGEIEKSSAVPNPTGSNILLVSLVSGLPKGAIAKIGARDLRRATDYLVRFIFGDQPTGD